MTLRQPEFGQVGETSTAPSHAEIGVSIVPSLRRAPSGELAEPGLAVGRQKIGLGRLDRRHSALGYRWPINFEKQHLEDRAGA